MESFWEFEVEAHACLPREKKDFVVRLYISQENIEFYMQNGNVGIGTEIPTLITALVFDSELLETGFEEGRQIITEILNALTITTSATFRYKRSIRLVDWTEGLREREYKVSKPFPGHELPYEHLEPALLVTAMRIWASRKSNGLQLAVHWFSSGIAARLPEDQFQFFWFVLELIAERKLRVGKVHDPVHKVQLSTVLRKLRRTPNASTFQ